MNSKGADSRIGTDLEGEDSRIGTVLGDRYRITERLGEGGMGVVYRGERLQLGRPVAIKFLIEPLTQDSQFMARFEREARAMSQLSHPNCVSVIDFGVEDTPYIVMDFVTGKTLREVMNEGPIHVGRSLHIVKQLLASLAHAHNQGIIHRDIKPDNIMLSEATGMGDHVRIFDFGLAKLLEDTGTENNLSRTNFAMGTPNYMSPEQTLGNKVDARCDLYAAGIVLFELLTEERPFFDDNPFKVMQMHRESPLPTLAMASDGKVFSPELEAVIAQALAKEPDDRFQSAKDFAEALMSVPEGTIPPVIITHETPTVVGPTVPHSSSSSKTLAIAAIALIAISAALALAFGLAKGMRSGEVPSSWLTTAAEFTRTDPEDDKPRPDRSRVAEPKEDDVVDYDLTAYIGTGATDESAPTTPLTISQIRELLVTGQNDEAIAALRTLRRANPKNGQYPYMMAGIFFEKRWYKDCLDHYREAIRLNPGFRGRRTLNEQLIAMLDTDKIYQKVRFVLINEVGRAALPYLRRAAKVSSNQQIRRRAASTARALSSKKK